MAKMVNIRLLCSLHCRAVFIILFACFPFFGCLAQENNQKQYDLAEEKKAEDPNTWDFGQAKHGEVLKHNFVLKNESAKVMNIKQVNTSCGCATSEVKKKTLLPQESTEIEVKFDTKGYSGPTQKYIYVTIDHLDNPIIRFIIKADVVK